MENLGRETEQIEFKESTVELNDGLIAMTAMLNKRCYGILYFGVKNNGDVIGQDVGKSTITKISQAFKNYVDPTVIPRIDILTSSDGKEYLKVTAEGNNRPYAFRGDIYIRSGEENKRIPMSELRILFQSTSDLLKESTATTQDLTFDSLCKRLSSKGLHVTDGPKFHRSYGLLNGKGTFNMQAELLSDQNSLPLTVVIFSGVDRSSISLRKQFNGPLLDAMGDAYDYVESLNESKVDMSGAIRSETKLLDSKALDEAWVNACVHNSWMLGIPPTIHIYSDRLEIISYGGRPYFQDEEGFFNGETMPVNESLMQIFLAAGIAEHTGNGIPIITKVYGRTAFEMDGSIVKVTMNFPFLRGDGYVKMGSNAFSKNESMILDAILEDPHITIDAMSESTSLGRSNVAKTISTLKRRGIVSRKGSKKTGSWIITCEPSMK